MPETEEKPGRTNWRETKALAEFSVIPESRRDEFRLREACHVFGDAWDAGKAAASMGMKVPWAPIDSEHKGLTGALRDIAGQGQRYGSYAARPSRDFEARDSAWAHGRFRVSRDYVRIAEGNWMLGQMFLTVTPEIPAGQDFRTVEIFGELGGAWHACAYLGAKVVKPRKGKYSDMQRHRRLKRAAEFIATIDGADVTPALLVDAAAFIRYGAKS